MNKIFSGIAYLEIIPARASRGQLIDELGHECLAIHIQRRRCTHSAAIPRPSRQGTPVRHLDPIFKTLARPLEILH